MTGGLIKGLGNLSSQRLSEWLYASGLIHEPDAFIFSPVHRANRAQINTGRPLSTRALEDIFARAWHEGGPGRDVKPNKNRYRGVVRTQCACRSGYRYGYKKIQYRTDHAGRNMEKG